MKKIYSFLLAVVLLSSCAKDLEEYNVDQKRATAVPAATLFTAAQKSFADVITSPSVNTNAFRFDLSFDSTRRRPRRWPTLIDFDRIFVRGFVAQRISHSKKERGSC